MATAPTLQQVEAVVAPVLAAAGYELVLVSFAGGTRTLRLTIDRLVSDDATDGGAPGDGAAAAGADADAVGGGAPVNDIADADVGASDTDQRAGHAATPATQGGIGLDDCTRASRLADEALEAAGLNGVVDHDSLEVSSPGLERPLTKPVHFRRFVGELARLHVAAGVLPERRRKLKAVLVQATATHLTVRSDADEDIVLAYADVESAQLVYQDPRQDPRQKPRQNSRQASRQDFPGNTRAPKRPAGRKRSGTKE